VNLTFGDMLTKNILFPPMVFGGFKDKSLSCLSSFLHFLSSSPKALIHN
jgi:hypothetical protein